MYLIGFSIFLIQGNSEKFLKYSGALGLENAHRLRRAIVAVIKLGLEKIVDDISHPQACLIVLNGNIYARPSPPCLLYSH